MKKIQILSATLLGLLFLSTFAIILPQAVARPTPAIEAATTTDKINTQVGDTVTYTFEVTNTGGVTLFNVQVVSDNVGSATKISESGRTANNKLESGETWIYTASHTILSSDSDPFVNTVTATADTRKGDTYSATDSSYVFLYGGAGDVLPDVLTSPNPEHNGGWYGDSVAIGEGLIVVGAAYESIPITTALSGTIAPAGKPVPAPTEYYGAGRAYVYSATTGALLDTLSSPNPVDYGWFGYSVAVGDGVIVVGAPRETSGSFVESGNAYVYNAATRGLLATLTSDDPVSDLGGNGQGYGSSVAVNEGIIAVGSSRETVNTVSSAGKVYLYDAVTRTQKAFSPLVTPDPTDLGRFGWSIAVAEGVIVVGAPNENIVGTGGYEGPSGRVYTFDATTGDIIDTVISLNPEFYGWFGSSVGVGDGVIVIGAPDETVGANEEAGRAYIYDLTSETITYTLVSQNSQYRGLFGNSVAVGDGVVVVGAIIENRTSSYPDAGNAYIFNAGTGAYTETLTNPDPTGWTEFGWSVAVNDLNGMIAVGAYDAVFLFE